MRYHEVSSITLHVFKMADTYSYIDSITFNSDESADEGLSSTIAEPKDWGPIFVLPKKPK